MIMTNHVTMLEDVLRGENMLKKNREREKENKRKALKSHVKEVNKVIRKVRKSQIRDRNSRYDYFRRQ